MFSPRLNPRPVACDSPVGEWLRCTAYETRAYVSYETADSARVDVVTSVEGQNAWWIFGWNYDFHRDVVRGELSGPQDGWTAFDGTVEVDVDRRPPPTGGANASASLAGPASVGR